jgi:hypothetical protein
MKISETKKLLRDMCRALGHDCGKYGKCTRCQKKLPWIIWESIGIVIYNKLGVTKIKFDS